MTNPAIEHWIAQARKEHLLSREEEQVLARRARRGNVKAREQLVKSSLRYVVAIALQYQRYGIPLEDLISDGNVGLMIALGKFDPNVGTRFVTYAGYWIRAMILENVVRSRSMVGAGSGPFRSKLFFKLRRERARAQNLTPEVDEQLKLMAKRMGIDQERLAALLQRLDNTDVSLDVPVGEDGHNTMVDTMASSIASPEEIAARSQRNDNIVVRVRAALNTLDPRERKIVENRMWNDESDTLASLGRELGISRERARQLEARAKDRLRLLLGDLAPAFS